MFRGTWRAAVGPRPLYTEPNPSCCTVLIMQSKVPLCKWRKLKRQGFKLKALLHPFHNQNLKPGCFQALGSRACTSSPAPTAAAPPSCSGRKAQRKNKVSKFESKCYPFSVSKLSKKKTGGGAFKPKFETGWWCFQAGVELAPPPSITHTGVHYTNTVSLHLH